MYDTGAGIILITAIFYLFSSAIGVVDYVLFSLGLYTLSSRRGLKSAWLAWLPVTNAYVLGYIADTEDENEPQRKIWRGLMLTFSILNVIFAIVFIVAFAALLVTAISVPENSLLWEEEAFILKTFFSLLVPCFLFLISNIVYSVLAYICLYKLFNSTDSKNAVLMLVLSIFIPLAASICIFICRKKGYPQVQIPDIDTQIVPNIDE